MPNKTDDQGDARSRDENSRYREMAERQKSANPEYTYAPRWVPTGKRRMSAFNLIVVVFGVAIILTPIGMWLFGVIR